MGRQAKSKYYLEWSAKRGLEPRQDEGEPVFGPPSPTADVLAQHYVGTADQFMRDTRKAIFGSPEPPFEADEAGSVAWFNAHHDRKSKATLLGSEFPKADERFFRDTEELVRVTGFSRRAVYDWLLTGAEPRLAPFVITPQHYALADTELRTRRVQITIYAPLEPREKKAIWDKLRGQWEYADFKRGFIELPQRVRYRVSERSRAVLELCSRTPSATWKERADEWNRTPHKKPFTPDGLRHHYNRAKKKQDDLASDRSDTAD